MSATYNTTPTDAQLDDFRRAALEMNQAVPQDGSALAAHALAVVNAIDRPLARNARYTGAERPVTRYLDQCLDERPTAFPGLIATLRNIGTDLHWQTNPNYTNEFPQQFLDNEAFAEVIGPDGILVSSEVRLCLLMMGPETHYPLHSHEPTELYHVLSGTALWRKGEEEWSLNPTGTLIFHDVFQGHEMQTAAEPLLAIASWIGNLAGGEAKPVK